MSELSTPAAGQLSLQMLRADVNVREFQRWAGIKRLHDNDHAMHCLLTECFGREMSPKPFRTIFPRGGSKGVLYGYGRADANALRDAAGIYALPPAIQNHSHRQPEQQTDALGVATRKAAGLRDADSSDRSSLPWLRFPARQGMGRLPAGCRPIRQRRNAAHPGAGLYRLAVRPD